ncbi:MAG: ABC transporter ATP-binding protein [Candidatus Eisenbacteria bacterium]
MRQEQSLTADRAIVLELRDLIKVYGRGEGQVTALRGVSFDVARGEMIAIMGSSGSGKSTLMNLIGCLDRPTGGSYRLDGEDVSLFGPDRLAEIRNQRIGFVFQNFNLLPRTSALENVELPLLYRAGLKDGAQGGAPSLVEQARRALERVGLAERAKHHPSQLSGGQQQRVAIARALVNEPSLLLADEPTGNLDSRTSVEIMKLFQELNRKGMTIVLITHEHDIAEYARRVIVLRDGRIQSDRAIEAPRDAAEELLRLPPPE